MPSKVFLATLWVTRGFHSDDFIWFSQEHCTLIITFIEHEAFFFFFKNPHKFHFADEAEAHSE